MEKNRTGKYLKYAIGEIVLVVIGILIALSINNWNEEQKSDDKAKLLFSQVQKELAFNIKNTFGVSDLYRNFHDTVSKAFSKSKNIIMPGSICVFVYSKTSNIVLMFSPMYLSLM